MLELDRFAKPLVNCPLLLDSAGYLPDTVDLTQDKEAREYWLQCFEDATEKVRVFLKPLSSLLLCSDIIIIYFKAILFKN
jgi:hypothetical protein